jgi:hypothetical protein
MTEIDDEPLIPDWMMPGWTFYILDDDHQLVEVPDLMQWAEWSFGENEDRRFIALDRIGDITVSTIFLGMKSNSIDALGFQFRPFETLVTGERANIERKYRTWDEALAGHRGIVNELRGKGN